MSEYAAMKEIIDKPWNFWQEQWYAEFVRATIFSSEPVKMQNAEAWWETCLTGSPEEINKKPALAQVTLTGNTPDKSYLCLLNCMPDRVDWNILKTVSPESKYADRQYDIGPVNSAVDVLLQILDKWIAIKNGPYSRIAFGAAFHLPAKSKEESYKKMASMLSSTVKIDAVNSSDFVYRINRPHEIKLGDNKLTINKLASWISLSGYPAPIALMSSSFSQIQFQLPSAAQPIYTAVRLELDINTKPDTKLKILDSNFMEVFMSLIRVANSIASDGDKL